MPKNEPQRSCLGCRETRDKNELLRFVLAPDRTLVPDLQHKLPGRGAYTCAKRSCLKAAADRKQFARSFRGEVRHGSADELVGPIGVTLRQVAYNVTHEGPEFDSALIDVESLERQHAPYVGTPPTTVA